jgi:hypothetical protein
MNPRNKYYMNQRVTALIWAFPYADTWVTITGTVCGIVALTACYGGVPAWVFYQYEMCRDARSNESGWKYVSNTNASGIPEQRIWPAEDQLRFVSFVGRLVLET